MKTWGHYALDGTEPERVGEGPADVTGVASIEVDQQNIYTYVLRLALNVCSRGGQRKFSGKKLLSLSIEK
jgi:hypothetical protein